MKKIKVHNRFTSIQIFFTIVFIVFILLVSIYAIYNTTPVDDYFSHRVIGESCALIALAITFLLFLISEWKLKVPYIDYLELTDRSLIIVNKNGCLTKNDNDSVIIINEEIITIPKPLISSVQAILHTEQSENNHKITYVNCYTEVRIFLNDGSIYVFEDKPSNGYSTCLYEFFLRFIDFAKQLPNFTYVTEGNWQFALADVDYYAKCGERIPKSERLAIAKMIYSQNSEKLSK